MNPSTCQHEDVSCLNEYELIRKYRCQGCGAVMMCGCDESRGRRFVPHQLNLGVDLKTQKRIPVNLGFQPTVCPECRGKPVVMAPKAAIHGGTSKIRRYYWREIMFQEYELCEANGVSIAEVLSASTAEGERIRTEALESIKRLHENAPKYAFTTESEAAFLLRSHVMVEELEAIVDTGGAIRQENGGTETAEDFAIRALAERGYSAIRCESRPLHVLFAVLLVGLIQDPQDPHMREVAFGDRVSFEQTGRRAGMISTALPDDFGTSGYASRRTVQIEEFFSEELPRSRRELLSAFDAQLELSFGLRQYLWAHRNEDIESARRMIEVVPPNLLRQWLMYLLDDYWTHYIGWPDLLAWRNQEILLAEVKLRADKLSDEQRAWIEHNANQQWCAFCIIKIRKKRNTIVANVTK